MLVVTNKKQQQCIRERRNGGMEEESMPSCFYYLFITNDFLNSTITSRFWSTIFSFTNIKGLKPPILFVQGVEH